MDWWLYRFDDVVEILVFAVVAYFVVGLFFMMERWQQIVLGGFLAYGIWKGIAIYFPRGRAPAKTAP